MPQDYRRGGGTAYGPARTASLFVPAGDDLADAALRARTASNNPEPFTAEHAAAYYAFAGISDRVTAVNLHRAYVGWDDIAGYTKAGIGPDNFRRMQTLGRGGITPAVFVDWSALPRMTDDTMIALVAAGLTADQVRPYLTPDIQANAPAPIGESASHRAQLPRIIEVGPSARRVYWYRKHGITNPANMIVLHRKGCRPGVVRDYRKATRSWAPEDSFVRWYGMSVDHCGNHEVPDAVYRAGGTHADVVTWHATGQPADRITLFIAAGFTADEVTSNPRIADADAASLAMMGTLRAPAPLTLDQAVTA